MKLSLSWLSDFLTWKETDPHAIADRLTLAVAEVEEVEEQGKLLNHCCIGNVIAIKRHPNADRLSLCDVETDRGRKRVVCGGTNVKEGMLVAFAHIGATVRWHGTEMMTLAPVKIRGEASEGMICAAEELDLAGRFPANPSDGEHPIIDLSKLPATSYQLPAGTPLREALGLNDVIFHIPNTAITHRPDLFSHIGFARECVAAGLAMWKSGKEPLSKPPTFPRTALPFKTIVEDAALVPRYCACLLSIEAIGQTPDWMCSRLEATGWRSINVPIDITNYVTMEIGMPLHSFDADDIRGDVHVRGALAGESITTLDGIGRKLPEGAVVLSDGSGIFDLLGIMGGLRSSTKDSTKRIYLHSAIVDPKAIRRAIISTGHRTEAATVYEKGIPAVTAMRGFLRALELFQELVPGACITSALENRGSDGKPKPITVPMEKLIGVLGSPIKPTEASAILKNIGCSVQIKKSLAGLKLPSTKLRAGSARSSKLVVTPPLHRLRDLTMDMDIIEEVARLHGYAAITPKLPSAAIRIPQREERIHKLRDALKEDDFNEIVPLSLLSAKLLERSGLDPNDAIGVQHPLSEDTALLQTSTLPGLLEHAQKNILHAGGSTIAAFHLSHVFGKKIPEHTECGVLLASLEETGLRSDPFLRLKQSLRLALAAAGYDFSILPVSAHSMYAHPGRSASIEIQGKPIGHIFEIHPTVRACFDLRHRAAAATFDVDALLSMEPVKLPAQAIPQFPAVTYDSTITRSQKESFAGLIGKLRKSHPLLKGIEVHDLFAGAPLKAGEYNLTLRCTYRAADRTLTEEEAKEAHEKVMAMAKG